MGQNLDCSPMDEVRAGLDAIAMTKEVSMAGVVAAYRRAIEVRRRSSAIIATELLPLIHQFGFGRKLGGYERLEIGFVQVGPRNLEHLDV